MTKLNQIIAVLSGKKTQSQKDLTEIYKRLQKPAMFDGISRTYQPTDEDGETQPAEQKFVQYTARQAMGDARRAVESLFDVAATQDWSNCSAKGDVIVDGKTVLSEVPVTYLLFLEKQLVDLQTFVSQLPVLDPAEKWTWDEAADCFASQPFFTNRTKKTPRSHVLYEATKEHPAQVEMFTEDIKAGEWRTVKFSGALRAQDKNSVLERIRKLQEAVKFGREQANGMEVTDVKTSAAIFDFVFGAQS